MSNRENPSRINGVVLQVAGVLDVRELSGSGTRLVASTYAFDAAGGAELAVGGPGYVSGGGLPACRCCSEVIYDVASEILVPEPSIGISTRIRM